MVKMEKKSISVKIYNDTYVLATEASEEQVLEIANLVDGKMKALAQRKRIQSTDKVAVWTALDLAAELVELKGRYEALLAAATER